MQNFCSLPNNHKCLVCEFPPCNCEKCTKLRAEGKPDQDEIKKCLMTTNDINYAQNMSDPIAKSSLEEKTNKANKFIQETFLELRKMSWPALNLTPLNLESFLFDIVGIISFFIMATFIFWITISQYLWNLMKLIIQAGRRPQLITLILVILLCVSITFHAFKGRHHHQLAIRSNEPLSPNTTDKSQTPKCLHLKSCQRRRCSHFNLQNSNKNCGSNVNTLSPIKDIRRQCDNCKGNLLDQSTSSNTISSDHHNPSLCDLCAKQMKDEDKSQHILSDEEFREMYKKFKLYTIPTEMKTPPSINRLLEFLTSLYNIISGSLVR